MEGCEWGDAGGRGQAGARLVAQHPAAQTAKAGDRKLLLHLELKPYGRCENVTFLLELLLVTGVQLWRQVGCQSQGAP